MSEERFKAIEQQLFELRLAMNVMARDNGFKNFPFPDTPSITPAEAADLISKMPTQHVGWAPLDFEPGETFPASDLLGLLRLAVTHIDMTELKHFHPKDWEQLAPYAGTAVRTGEASRE